MCPFAQNYFLNKNIIFIKGIQGGARAFSQALKTPLNQKNIKYN